MNEVSKIYQHRVFRSALSLGILQISNYAIPILILPFLTRKLGVESFGIIAISLAASQIIYTFIDYGFSLSATYKISINRRNQTYINRKIGAIFCAQAIIIIIAALFTLSAAHIFFEDKRIFYFSLFSLIAASAQGLQPIWLFQGTEKMGPIAVYSIITKLIYATLTLSLVECPEHALIVVAAWAAAQIVGLICSIIFMYKDGHSLSPPTITSIITEFKEGAEYFWSRIAVAGYTSASTLIVGSTGTNHAAQFSVCNQIYKAGQSLTSPINSAMFPYMAKEKDWKAFYYILAFTTSTLMLGCLVISLFSEDLLVLIFGKEYGPAWPILSIFLATTIANYLAASFGYSAFSALDRVTIANKSVLIGAAVHAAIIASLFLSDKVSAKNIAISILATELLVAGIRITLFVKIKKTWKPKKNEHN